MNKMTMTPSSWPYPGARWWKCDLHTHTPASSDYGSGPNQPALMARTPEEWLLDYMRAGIDCVAVTDHNSGAWIDQLKQAYFRLGDQQPPGFRELFIFPGVELSIGRIHALVLLDPSQGTSDIEAIIGAAKYRGTRGQSDHACEASPTEIAEEVAKRGGLFIPAHADRTKGIFKELRGHDLRPWLDIDSIVGAEVLDASFINPSLYDQAGLRWAQIVGSDAHHPDDQGGSNPNYPGSRWTMVKMGGTPSIDGLRCALLDGRLSVHRSTEMSAAPVNATPAAMITMLSVDGTTIMGNGEPSTISFNPWLNAFIGDRGTGKSSVVHFLRQALERHTAKDLGSEESSRAGITFKQFMQPTNRGVGVVKAGTKIEVDYLLNTTRFRIHSGGGTSDHVVAEQLTDGGWVKCESQEVRNRFKVNIISQDQIADLSANGAVSLLRLIDDETDRVQFDSTWSEKRARYMTLSAGVRELNAQIKQEDRLLGLQQDIKKKLDQFESANHSQVLKDFERQTLESGAVGAEFHPLNALMAGLSELEKKLAEDYPNAQGVKAISAVADQQVSEAVRLLRGAFDKAREQLRSVHMTAFRASTEAKIKIDGSQWKRGAEAAIQAHREHVARLKAQGVENPDEFGGLIKQRQLTEGQLKYIGLRKAERNRLLDESQQSLGELIDLRTELTQRRDDFLRTVLADNKFVRMSVVAFGERNERQEQQIREWLRLDESGFAEDVSLIRQELYGGLPDDLEGRIKEFKERLFAVKLRLIGITEETGDRWSKKFASRIQRGVQAQPEMADNILTWFPEDSVTVQYNASKSGGDDWKDVLSGSGGQKSAAMLAFLLAYGTEPIVLDQPEDDLDNQIVYDLVVEGIRQHKTHRQIIVVTHDANVVVNGDAEAVHVMEYRNGQCWLRQSDSLQSSPLREQVCQIMEGGRTAFESRYHRLREAKQ